MIGANTQVFPFFHNRGLWTGGERIWIKSVENKKDSRIDRLILWPTLDDDYREAKSFAFETFQIIRRRFNDELPARYRDLRAVLTAGENTDEVDAGQTPVETPYYGGRTVQHVRGLLVRPGHDVRGPAWFIRIFGEDGKQIDSIRAESPEVAAQNVFDRKIQDRAEKAPAPPKPVEVNQPGPRLRPGSV